MADVVAGYGTDVDLDVIRARWSLRSLQAIRWLIEHDFDPWRSGCEVDVRKSQLSGCTSPTATTAVLPGWINDGTLGFGGRIRGAGVVASREADGDVEATGGDGGGVHGAAVDRGDGRDEGEAETEAVVAGAVVEPGERQEQPVDLVGWDDRGRC